MGDLARAMVARHLVMRPGEAVRLIRQGRVTIGGVAVDLQNIPAITPQSVIAISAVETGVEGERLLVCTGTAVVAGHIRATFAGRGLILSMAGPTGFAKTGDRIQVDVRSVR